MRFKLLRGFAPAPSLVASAVALLWLALIAALHFALNGERPDRPVVRMGYMPVLTNLACPLLDAASKNAGSVRFEAIKFSAFAEMGQALRDGHIQAAFIIAPLSIVLRQQGADIKVVYIGNRHESTLVVRSNLPAGDFSVLAGKTLAVPQRYSGHNLLARRLQARFGAAGAAVRVVEMNPPDMPSALATGAIDAYFVGEPFGFAASRAGTARTLYNVEQLWPGFICNLMAVRADVIVRSPGMVRQLVHGAARSGIWARDHRDEAAAVVAPYWSQTPAFVAQMFDAVKARVVWDRFVPHEAEMQDLANQMVRYELLPDANVSGLVDDEFASTVRLTGVTDLPSILSATPQ